MVGENVKRESHKSLLPKKTSSNYKFCFESNNDGLIEACNCNCSNQES
ncbi:hypothetical protein Bhyg_12605 [Pseudolycoriella hygida]|uniref:Uncharacterized protein n=1 Tax=Pseudolycoriella hygida TaxID=35572 RepID=A0A9Q0S1F0_9DIPT|nr:hypothetical protein Bhyg_12605 [Pseudolycoriella hygida]